MCEYHGLAFGCALWLTLMQACTYDGMMLCNGHPELGLHRTDVWTCAMGGACALHFFFGVYFDLLVFY